MVGLFLSLFLSGLFLVIKVLKFTGAWISLLLVFLIDDILLGKVLGVHMTAAAYPDLFPTYEMALLVIMAIPVVLVTGYHIFRFFKPKPKHYLTPEEIAAKETEAYDRLTPEEKAAKSRDLHELADKLLRLRGVNVEEVHHE